MSKGFQSIWGGDGVSIVPTSAGTAGPPASVLLEAEQIVKIFPPNATALTGVNFQIRAGEVTSLLGANGAGKSTLTKILTGVEQPSSGRLTFLGKEIRFERPSDAMRVGISAVYQELPLLPNLSASENSVLGRPRPLLRRWSAASAEAVYRRVASLVPNPPPPTALVGELTVGQQQKVALIRALADDPQVLFVDEGTSSVSAEEREEVSLTLKTLAQERGIGVVYITHFIEDALSAGHRVVVFRDGGVTLEGDAAALTAAQVVNAIAPPTDVNEGRTSRESGHHPIAVSTAGTDGSGQAAVLSVEGMVGLGVGPLTFAAKAGEFIGLYGPPGCGASELLRSLAALEPSDGVVKWRGQPLGKTSHQRFAADVIYCSGDRAKNLVGNWSLDENILLFDLAGRAILARPRRRLAADDARALMRKYEIVGDPARPVGTFSGGNQQKVVVARALEHARQPLILADDVTRGVDVGGRSKVNVMLRNAADQGTLVLFYSTEPEEIVELCDRVLLLDGGRIRRELRHDEISLHNLELAGRTRSA